MRIRQANSGREFVGTALGQVPTWTGQEWTPSALPPAPPIADAFRVVNSLADLPGPVPTGNAAPRATHIITLETGVPYLFADTVDGEVSASERIAVVQPFGAVVLRVNDNVQWITNTDVDPGWTNANTYNTYSFAVANLGSGFDLRCFSPQPSFYEGWLAPSVRVDQAFLVWTGGIFGDMEIPNGVGFVQLAQAFGVVRCVNAGALASFGRLQMNQVYATAGTGGAALVDVGANLFFSRIELVQCGSDDLKLLRLGADVGAAGSASVNATSCQSVAATSIEVTAGMPLGGVEVIGGRYGTPAFSFAVTDPLAMCRGYRQGAAWGPETPLIP
jgi:hypothetical protein